MTDLIQRTTGLARVRCDLVQLQAPFAAERLELLAFRDVPDDADPRLPVRPGQSHVAYVVEDVDRAVDALVRAGGSQVGEIVQFAEGRGVYCWTPHGTVVELEEQAPPSAPAPGSTS
jgi:hypothetical protein